MNKPSPSTTIKRLQTRLLAWYDANKRDLPWRYPSLTTPSGQSPDSNLPGPYYTLVSEAMLQQTQVATVIPYFHRFLEAFPTLNSLANADEQAVLTLWQGLGYYRRARNLHACAQVIMATHQGMIPCDLNELLKLPGVGRYTAGAIASIAFNHPAPLVDGNVIRVLSRWFSIKDHVDETPVKKQLWSFAESLVPASRPGDFNQAMMELGALVCSPRSPKCEACPIKTLCLACKENKADSYPRHNKKETPSPGHSHYPRFKTQ